MAADEVTSLETMYITHNSDEAETWFKGIVKPKLKFQSPFDRLRHQMSDVLGDGGILKEVVQPGTGTPIPSNASVLSIAVLILP